MRKGDRKILDKCRMTVCHVQSYPQLPEPSSYVGHGTEENRKLMVKKEKTCKNSRTRSKSAKVQVTSRNIATIKKYVSKSLQIWPTLSRRVLPNDSASA